MGKTDLSVVAVLCAGATVNDPVRDVRDAWKARIIKLGPYGRDEYDLGVIV